MPNRPGKSAAGTRDNESVSFSLTRDDGLVISDEKERLDLDRVCSWLKTAYWAASRDRQTVERSIANSHAYGVYAADGQQVALTRATTDYASFAWIGDVFVDEAWRGKGIGRWLIANVIEHLHSLGVPRFVLATRDAHEVYRAVGFEELRAPQMWMELDRRPPLPPAGDTAAAAATGG
jgi:GNAT superfamily N-acetyltransferase